MAIRFFSILAAVLLSMGCTRQPSQGVGGTTQLEPVEFLSGNTVLSGTLARPTRVIAAVVLVHGSGQTERNVPLAEALAHAGIATLTYDKRGLGDSGGIYVGPE